MYLNISNYAEICNRIFDNIIELTLDQINQIDAYFVQIWHDLGMRPRGENYCKMYFPYSKTPP